MNDADRRSIDLSFASRATAGTSVAHLGAQNLAPADVMSVYAKLQGATGGTLDVYLQVLESDGVTWVDYAHFPQLAAGAAAVEYSFTVSRRTGSAGIKVVGSGMTPALAANQVVGGDFGGQIRVLQVAGAGTSAGAAQTIKLDLAA